jgi:cell division protein FtsW
MTQYSLSNIFKGDKVIWMILFLLCMISIVEVFSASSVLTYKSQNYFRPITFHTLTIIIGVVVTIIIHNVPYRYFRSVIPYLLLFSAATLIWVWLAGTKVGDAGRWISLFGITFQPSEIAKGTIVLAVAQILAVLQREKGADKSAIKWILWITIPICVLIGLENLSTAVMLFFVVFLMMFFGLVPLIQLAKLAGFLILVVVVALSMIMLVGHDINGSENEQTKIEQVESPHEKSLIEKVFHRIDTWKSRIIEFGKPMPAPKVYDLDKNAQVAHANIAIMSSGILGKGPGKSTERDFLAQAFSDFIFAIIIEELGLLGAFAIVFLYIILLFRCARIANRSERKFPAFLVLGIGLLLVSQAIFNMMVAVGLVPVTGQPLPLVSKGGTSTIINCAYIGVILSVSRFSNKRNHDESLRIQDRPRSRQ